MRALVIIYNAARHVHSRRRCAGSAMSMSDTDFADYDSKVTFMFPGQGAQYMGMAATICDEVCGHAYFETCHYSGDKKDRIVT